MSGLMRESLFRMKIRRPTMELQIQMFRMKMIGIVMELQIQMFRMKMRNPTMELQIQMFRMKMIGQVMESLFRMNMNGVVMESLLWMNMRTNNESTDPHELDARDEMNNGITVPHATDVVTSGIAVPDLLEVSKWTDEGITIPDITDVSNMMIDGISTPDGSNATTIRHSDVDENVNSLAAEVSVPGAAAFCITVDRNEDTLVETEEKHCSNAPANDAGQRSDGFIAHSEHKDLVIHSGVPIMVLNEIENIRFPMSPPVRGRCKVKKGKPVRENSFKSRLRLLDRKGRKACKASTKDDAGILTNEEMMIIADGKNLWDSHMYAASSMLKQDYPQIQGLQSTLLGTKLHFDIGKGKFVQVLRHRSITTLDYCI